MRWCSSSDSVQREPTDSVDDGGMDLVGGQALQQILEHRIVRCAPKRAVELDAGGQSGGIIRLGKRAVAVNQGLQAHQVHFGAHRGGFLGGLAFEQDAQVIDLHDLLGVDFLDEKSAGAAL